MNHGRLLGAMLLAAFSYAANATDYPAIAGEYVVKLKPVNSTMSASSLSSFLGGEIKRTLNANERLLLVQRPVVELRETALQAFAQNALVEYAEPNFIYRALGGQSSMPTDGRLSKMWGLKNEGAVYSGDGGNIAGRTGVDIDAENAWKVETGSHEVVVGVIDTGVNYSNPDLAANIYVNEAEKNGQAGVDDDGNGYVDDVNGYDFAAKDANPMDVYGHGTHVSGTIGAVPNNGDGIVGVAWNVRILPIRFLGDDGGGSLADAVLSIDYGIKMKVNILSNSWGGGPFSQALLDAVKRSRDAGILFVAAAGNDSTDNDKTPIYPGSYDVENVIAVSAIDPAGLMADFSSYGKTKVHIAAPGVNILSWTMRGLESWSGTSMACPHVSGVAALLYSQDLSQSYTTIKNRILASARPMASQRGRVATGGMLNAYYALTNTVAPVDMDDPFNWQKDTQMTATPHPYAKNARHSYTLTVPGAKRVAAFFTNFETEAGYDKVEFKDANGKSYGSLSGKLGETFGPPVDGDTIVIEFSADDSNQGFGFEVGGIAYQ